MSLAKIFTKTLENMVNDPIAHAFYDWLKSEVENSSDSELKFDVLGCNETCNKLYIMISGANGGTDEEIFDMGFINPTEWEHFDKAKSISLTTDDNFHVYEVVFPHFTFNVSLQWFPFEWV